MWTSIWGLFYQCLFVAVAVLAHLSQNLSLSPSIIAIGFCRILAYLIKPPANVSDLMKESQKVWARLAYWENCQRVGPIHLVSKRFVRVVWTESCGCRSGGDHGCSMATNLMGGGAGATAAGKTPPGPAEDDSAGEVWCLSTLFEGPSHLSLRSDDGDPGLHPTLKTRLKIGRGSIQPY